MTTTPHAPEKVAGGVHVANAPGTTEISVRTLERIVAQAIKAVPGTVGIDSKLAGIGGRGYPRSIVQADPDTQMTAVDSTIAVAWPSPVTQVAAQTRAAIVSALAQFTGYSTTRVNVTVGHLEPSTRVSNSAAAAAVDFHAAIPVINPSKISHPTTKSSSTNVRRFDPSQWEDRTQVRSVATPQSLIDATSVSTPDPVEVRSVNTPAEVQIRPSGEVNSYVEEVYVPEFTPRELHLKPVEVPEEQPLREIHVESANPEPSRVNAPQPVQLRHIEVHPVEVFSPEIKPWSALADTNSEANDEKGARS